MPLDDFLTRKDWIAPRQDRWTDILPESWQTAINTSPTLNALARYMARPSFEEGVKQWQDSIPGNSPIDRIADRKSTLAQEFPQPMNPLGQSLMETGGFLANFIGPGAKLPPASAPKPQGIRAFHGSPHDFDKFDISKIGTGEGAQAYGRGLYFAENENVADAYRRVLGYKAANPERKLSYDPDMIAQSEMNYHLHNGRTPDEARKLAIERLSIGAKSYATTKPDEWHVQKGFDDFPRLSDAYRQAAERLASNKDKKPGHMYEVRINADPETFLDWDKPLSQQPEAVRRALEKIGVAAPDRNAMKAFDDALLSALEGDGTPNLPKQPSDPMGEQIVRRLHSQRGSSWLDPSKEGEAAASQALRDAGIPGIKYKDQMSRGTDGGTSNFVVFDAALIEILRKYGLLPPIAAGGALMGGPSDASASPAP